MRSVLLASCVLILACSGGGQLPGMGAGGTLLTETPNGDCSARDDLVGCTCVTPNVIRDCSPLAANQPRGDCHAGTQMCIGGGSTEIKTYTWGPCTGYENCGSTHDGTSADGGTHDGLNKDGGLGHTNDGKGDGSANGNTNDGKGGGGGLGNTNDGRGGGAANGNTNDGRGGGAANGNTNDGRGGGGTNGNTNDGRGGGAGIGQTGDGLGGGAGLGQTGDGLGGGAGIGQTGDGLGGGAGIGQTGDGLGGGHTDDGQGGSGVTHDADECPCPGVVRWCDDYQYCNWGKQTCLPDGTWGPCIEVKTHPTGCATEDNKFDGDCCARMGLCCAWTNETLYGPCLPNGCPAASADP